MIEFEKFLVFRRLKSCLHIFTLVYQSNFLVCTDTFAMLLESYMPYHELWLSLLQ
ncbi:hypothetical protein RHGRI_023826 [Rhododendron griersonianum]|uniref:Uncharacterized protein n=1 Tax=Rhododendron griersonianum TaxID=479676 RepID=A0AAV6J6V4_9ERIC|nr:hypothetical protein RHGRI_023826 [Rhododendron griersonianum]